MSRGMKWTEEEHDKAVARIQGHMDRDATAAHDHGTDDVPLIRSQYYDVRVARALPPKAQKYRNVPTVVHHHDGTSRKFRSKAEAARYRHNLARIDLFGSNTGPNAGPNDPLMHQHCQVPFRVSGMVQPYRCDFMEYYWSRKAGYFATVYTEIAGLLLPRRLTILRQLLREYPHIDLQVLQWKGGQDLEAAFIDHPKWTDPRPKTS